MNFSANISDAGSSATREVSVEHEGHDTLRVTGEKADDCFSLPLSQCIFRPPLGRIRRVIELPDGRLLESDDLESVDSLAALGGKKGGLHIVHAIESKWRLALASIVIVIVGAWGVYRYGIPYMAKSIAFKLPASSLEAASDGTIKILEFAMFDKSQLSKERREEIQQGFDDVVASIGSGEYDYHLHFRSAKDVPNAMALPSGDIFVTDALIEGAEEDEEIFAVLAHELTHVEQRHGMRMVLQDTGVFFLSTVMLGDVASASAVASGLPAALAESNYSREFENEADAGAAHYCIKCGWTTSPMRSMLNRIAPGGNSTAMGWISSHPDTAERVRRLKELEARLTGKKPKADAPVGDSE